MAKADYPLLLSSHLAKRVWAGNTLGEGIGEAWDLSVHPNGPSTIRNGGLQGRTLAEVTDEMPECFGGPIELLAKRLDCGHDLSVQVHPKNGDSKTEAWVVLRGDKSAGVYHGFRDPVTPRQIRDAAQDGSLPELLRFVSVRPGQCVFVPSGTVHAIGGGLFLFELQQSADTTFRLYDWGRGRDLHLDEGLQCCELNGADGLPAPHRDADGSLCLVDCDHFRVNRVDTHAEFQIDPGPQWRALFVVAGAATIGGETLIPGDTALVPTAAGATTVTPGASCTALLYGPGAR